MLVWCLARFWKQAQENENETQHDNEIKAIGFTELVIYIKVTNSVGGGTDLLIFELAELINCVKSDEQQELKKDVNSSKLKDKLMTQMLELDAYHIV